MTRFKIFLLLLMLFTGGKLHAQISATPSSGCAPLLNVQFDSPQTATLINWDFGDGTFANFYNPQHSYLSPGDYLVQYSATVAGNPVTDQMTVHVYGKPFPSFRATS